MASLEAAGPIMARPPGGVSAGVKPPLEVDRFCRVTLLTARTRMDVSLPTDLTVAELVPMLCDLAGESGPRTSGRPAGARQGARTMAHPTAWCLAAVAGAELPPRATLGELGVLDGDLLRLRRRAEAPPPPVFDDPVDAVAEVVPPLDGTPGPWGRPNPSGGEPGHQVPPAVRPWGDRCRRLAGLTGGGLGMLLAAVLLAAARGLGPAPDPVAAVIAGLASVAALAASVHAVRLDVPTAVLLASGALPLAAACGFAALPGVPGAGHLLLAAALVSAAGAAALAMLRTPAPVLVGAVPAAALTALAAMLAGFDLGSTAGLAAAASAAAVATLPLLSKVSIRLAGLPAPVVPTTAEEMLAADAQWQLDTGEDIRHRSGLAHVYLGGLMMGASAVAGIGAVLAAVTGGTGGAVFAAVVVAVLLLRSRAYATALASGAPMVAGLGTATALVVGLATAGPPSLRLTGGVLGLVAASTAVTLVWTGSERKPSPVARKAVDVAEALLVVATFPLALWVLDLYRAVQGL
ncbi:MAG TPA: type VII secretion integral membrane protein EccD [Pseudonocardia sp.]|jgi:type VII secretion integral membrane protein EccD|nr:type VII secretion integral membrane protein EccD [Pseudonocardia sp.]